MDCSAQLGSRALFPTLECRVYANHASVGPLPLPAIDAMHAAAWVHRDLSAKNVRSGATQSRAHRCRGRSVRARWTPLKQLRGARRR